MHGFDRILGSICTLTLATAWLACSGGGSGSGKTMPIAGTTGGTVAGSSSQTPSGGTSGKAGTTATGGSSNSGGNTASTVPAGGTTAGAGTSAGGGSATSGGNPGGAGSTATGGTLSSGGTKQTGGDMGGGGKGGTSGAGGTTGGMTGSGGGTTQSAGGSAGGITSSTGGNAGRTGGTGGTTASSSDPIIGTIKNPVIKGLWADPQVALFNGKFYIYPTTDGVANWGATVFHAFSSSDLAVWKDEGIILDVANVTWGKRNAWAPGITVKNGTYYYYFCAAQQIGVATSTSPTGPFKDILGKPLVTTGQYGGQSIDPYAFDDDDGRSYLFFGNGNANGAELNADMISFKTTPKTIALSGFREGSVVFKRNGKYYFMYSVSGTDYPDYRVAYAMSSSPLGPYTGGSTVLQSNTSLGIQSTGHNSVVVLPNGDFYMVYHRWAIPGGDGNHREICIDKMKFNADGTIAAVVPTL